MAVEILRPEADGDHVGLGIVGPANGWDAVNDITPDDDTSYVWNDGAAAYACFEMQNSAATTIASVDGWDRCKVSANADAGDQKEFYLETADGTGFSGGGLVTVTTSYVDRESAAIANPAGGGWTMATLNSVRGAIELRENGVDQVRCTQLWIEVNYTARVIDIIGGGVVPFER